MAELATPSAWTRPKARWILPNPASDAILTLQRALKVERLAAAVLAHRGFIEPHAAGEFLSPSLEALHDPLLMRGMEPAAMRLLQAVTARQPILIYGDYDVDGTTSIVILKKAIEILGGQADFHVPHRLNEGYGMRSDVIERASATGVRLIVSVDTGIRANEVVRHANALGIDVIVTDHHLPLADLPPALAVVNPNQPDCAYPDKNLCGAGVAFKLVEALLRRSNLSQARQAALLDSFLKPVAIATVADIVPLAGENRVIVHRGLLGLREIRNPGLSALLAVAGLDNGEIPSAHQVAFRLAPRINAAGRMATARDVIELFLTADAGRARALAEQLDSFNRDRQQIESEIIETILAECEQKGFDHDAPAAVFAASGWHLGVLGIVASRLVERFSRPVFVLSDSIESACGEPGALSGSGRSVPAFHLLEALESMPDLFERFGGHRQAAGLILRSGQLEEFRRRFIDFARTKLNTDDLRPQYLVDAEAAFTELTEVCIRNIFTLGPFGFGNPSPIFYACDVEVAGPFTTFKDGKHLTVPLRHQDRMLFCKAWNFGDRGALFETGAKLDILFQIEDDPASRKRGYGSWCLSLKDVRPANEYSRNG
ncbi:MAG: single-stranded-DNA-specific exonuclease RecJ [Acidobacteriaceae bacterium]|nr:single-stranded-DNA-specific exonuclease RecJ [Acidobacteriaceae bacterium]MBV9779756.1 single-stranded-DNA-specific exonuclease RecJ [Acidobacteriaceae bacterium]